MKAIHVLCLSLIVLTLLVNPYRTAAQVSPSLGGVEPCSAPNRCTGIWDYGDLPCTGANGCSDSFPDESCGDTCFCGICDERGSSGECCGHTYYVPNFYEGNGDCSNECGDIAIHARTHVNRQNPRSQHSLYLRKDYSPGLIMLTPTVSYKEPLFGYVYNRCSHTYRLIVEEGQTGKREEGM